VEQQLPEGSLGTILVSIDSLLSDPTVALRETSDDIKVSMPERCTKGLLDLTRQTLATLWHAVLEAKGLFELTVTMTRERRQEVLRLYEDCSYDPSARVFGESWEACRECSRLLSSFGEIYSSHDYCDAPQTVLDLISHLTVCKVRKVSVKLEITVNKRTLSEYANIEAGQPKFISLEFWYELKNFCDWFAGRSPWDFFRRYVQNLNRLYAVIVHHPKGLRPSENGAFIIVPTTELASLSDASRTTKRESDIARIRQETEGLAGETVLKNAPPIPPSILLLNVQDPNIWQHLSAAFSKILAYSIFSIVSDSVRITADWCQFSNDLPYGTQSVSLAFSADDKNLIIEIMGGTTHRILQNNWITNVLEFHTTFCELLGREPYRTLRKTAVSGLLKLKFGDIVELLLETKTLLTYYNTLRKQLLQRRIDDLAKVIEKLSDSAIKSSTSLSQMLESMQHDVSNLSIVLLGALLLQMYSYISKAVNVNQLILLLVSSGIVSSFLLLLVDFRLSDVEDAGNFVRETFSSLERAISQETGLRVATWEELVKNSHKLLVKRIETIDTLTWSALACDLGVVYYILLKLGDYGYSWYVPVLAGVITSVGFLAEFLLVRRTRSGVSKVEGRTSMGTFLLLISLLILAIGTSMLIIRSWSHIISEMGRILG